MSETKICHKCKRELPLEDFYAAKNSKDGYAPSCKDCQWGSPLGTRTSNGGVPPEPKKKVAAEKSPTKKDQAIRASPKQTANVQGLIPNETEEEPSVSALPEKMFRAKDLAWWVDKERVDIYGHPWMASGEWIPRAVVVISVNQEAGTAMVEYFKDPTALREKEQKLVPVVELRRRLYRDQD
jgi:hypothetical protein